MNKEGFTLVELIITLTLLVIIMALAVPNVINMVARNREVQLERTHEVVCEAARVFAYRRGSCGEFINDNSDGVTRIINFSDCANVINGAFTQPIQFLVDHELLSNILTDPTTGEIYDYNKRIVYGNNNGLLTVTLNRGNEIVHVCGDEGD